MTCQLVELSNGVVIATKAIVEGNYPYDTEISFTCDVGYSLDTTAPGSGSSAIFLLTGNWSHSTPRCNLSNGNHVIW